MSLFLGVFALATVNGIVFLISFSVKSLSVCGKATNPCMLTLCPALLLNVAVLRDFGGTFGGFFKIHNQMIPK